MNRLRCALSLIGLATLQTPARAESDAAFLYRWNGHGFYAAGGSMGETGAGLRGGGGGAEVFFWNRFTAGADISAFRDEYYRAVGTLGHAGAQVGYHFAPRDKVRGMDPFVLFGVGRFFPEASRAVVHGGGGFTYWFKQRVGAQFEFRVGERQYGDNIVGLLRLGIAFR